jgi:hypothetical protein
MQWRLDNVEKPERAPVNAVFKTGNSGAAKKLALVALLLAATTASAEELGRLFFTPEQRAQLEHGKSQNTDSGANSRALTVNGIVQKHGGSRTVWINGVPQPDGVNDDRAPESSLISSPAQSQPVKVKVGQRVLVNPAAPGK